MHAGWACRPSGKVVKHSAVCLSLTSPVFRKMICCSSRARTDRRMGLDDEDETPLRLAMELSYGLEEGVPVTDLDEMIRLAIFADRYEMVGVAAAVEDAIRRSYLAVETCLEVLSLKERDQLPGVVSAARELALKRFADMSRSSCFESTSEEVLCDLVGDDLLAADEENVLEAVVGWIKAGGAKKGRGERLLGEVRYGMLTALRLAELGLRAEEMVGEGLGVRLRALANEALQLPVAAQGAQEGGLLCSQAFKVRKWMDVAWEEYAEGRRQHRLVRDKNDALALCESGGRLFCGLMDGSLLEWDASTLEERRRLRCEGEVGGVCCMTACGALVIISDMMTAACGCGTRRRAAAIMSYGGISVGCSRGQYLVSGSDDKTVKVWSTEGAGSWPCLGTITVHAGAVYAMVVWEGRVVSGSSDRTVKLSDIVTRQQEAALNAHTEAVIALAVRGRTLLSTGNDTIGVWVLGTWSHLKVVRVSERVSDALCCCRRLDAALWCVVQGSQAWLHGGA